MTSVSGSSSSRPTEAAHTARRTAQPRGGKLPPEQDVRAMREALANARRQLGGNPREALVGKQQAGKQQTASTTGRGDVRDAGREGTSNRTDSLADPIRRDRDQQDGGNGQGGQAMAGQSAAPPPLTLAQMPAPHVDPSAFAQMLADLWTRENGKGAREVSVRFGADAWPATGARLVRNAAGALDIALLVGDRGRAYGERLPGLEARLSGAGVDVGALAIEDDA